MFAKFLAPLLIVAATAACVPTPAPLPTGDTSQSALDWPGSYAGTLPCADCSGLITELTLTADNAWTMSTTYEGKGGPYLSKGKFTWDAAGSIITLDGEGGKYQVGEGRLWALDMDGKRITGPLAKHYILTKK